jgi:hypothetical protein
MTLIIMALFNFIKKCKLTKRIGRKAGRQPDRQAPSSSPTQAGVWAGKQVGQGQSFVPRQHYLQEKSLIFELPSTALGLMFHSSGLVFSKPVFDIKLSMGALTVKVQRSIVKTFQIITLPQPEN